jgi:hypothetical protein
MHEHPGNILDREHDLIMSALLPGIGIDRVTVVRARHCGAAYRIGHMGPQSARGLHAPGCKAKDLAQTFTKAKKLSVMWVQYAEILAETQRLGTPLEPRCL